jgi:hypothetical protein
LSGDKHFILNMLSLLHLEITEKYDNCILIMDISTIYKEHKLYKVETGQLLGPQPKFDIPADFNGVSVLYEYVAQKELPAEMVSFIAKVIEGGMKLDPAKVLIANMNHSNVSLAKLAEANAKTVVIFGLQWLEGLHNANIRKNEIVKLYGMKVLMTDTLDIIDSNGAAKKAFWAELKKLF